MQRFVIRRVLYAIPTLLGISLFTFLLSRLAPGDPVRLVTFGADLTAEAIEAIRRAYGLDQPIPVQYVRWLGDLLQGDFGTSLLYHRPVLDLIMERLPNTLQLAVVALLLQLVIGVPLGVLAAIYRGGPVDQVVRVLGTVGHAIPTFWLGLVFIILFAVVLRWLPSQGMLTVGVDQADVVDRLKHIIMPAFVLSLAGIANYSRIMRTEMLDVINQDYVRTARSKGLVERSVIAVHALRNALIPMVTALGGILAVLVGGSVIVEQVFTWPGIGQLAYTSVLAKDYPVVQAAVMVSSLLLVISYLLRDVAYALVDPRVRFS